MKKNYSPWTIEELFILISNATNHIGWIGGIRVVDASSMADVSSSCSSIAASIFFIGSYSIVSISNRIIIRFPSPLRSPNAEVVIYAFSLIRTCVEMRVTLAD